MAQWIVFDEGSTVGSQFWESEAPPVVGANLPTGARVYPAPEDFNGSPATYIEDGNGGVKLGDVA